MRRHGEHKSAGKSVTFSIVVTYESNEDYDRDGFGDIYKTRDYGYMFNTILKAPDEVIRQQSADLLNNVPTKSARLFATRKVKLFFQAVTRQPQKIIYDMRKDLPYWRANIWLKDRAGLGQKS